MKNKLNVKVNKDTKIFKDLFEAKAFAVENKSYHFEVFDKDNNLIGYGVPK